MFLRHLEQVRKDHQRKSYRLSFPAELDEETVIHWLRSISGTLRSRASFLGALPTIVFEITATPESLIHRLKVPWQYAPEYIIPQLLSHVPGMSVTPEEGSEHHDWTRAVEIGLRHSNHSLHMPSTHAMATSLLTIMRAVKAGETLVTQWVVTPKHREEQPHQREALSDTQLLPKGKKASREEVRDRQRKLAEPNMYAVLRVGAIAGTDARAKHLIHGIHQALASTVGPHMKFYRRYISTAHAMKRLDEGSGLLKFPMQFSATELAGLIAWPIGSPNVSGLPPYRSRHLIVSEIVPREGRVIGRSNWPGNPRAVAVGYDDTRKHTHVLGPTGVGKTILLANMVKQDMEQGHGVIVIENKGDLFHQTLNNVPPNRVNDVIVLDVNDTSHPVGFNILNQGDPSVVIDELQDLFEHLDHDVPGIWTREVLFHGLHTLASQPELAFTDLSTLLNPRTAEEAEWFDDLVRKLKDPELRLFWQRYEQMPRGEKDRYTKPVMDRQWQLTARPKLRNIVGQSKSSFQMKDVIGNNKILLVNLENVPPVAASLMGTLLMNAAWHAVKTTRSQTPTHMTLDEFQDFTNLPINAEDMLAKARSLGLSMTLAHQHLAQLPSELKQAVMSNARSKVVFQTSVDDARAMANAFGNTVSEHDFMALGRYEAIARISTGDGVSAPLTLTTNAPAKPHGLARQVIAASRKQYGRPIAQVEKEIRDRHKVRSDSPKTRRPRIGTT